MAGPILSYQSPARSRPWTPAAAIVLWLCACLTLFAGLLLLATAFPQVAPSSLVWMTPRDSPWPMAIVAALLLLWGLLLGTLGFGIMRSRPRAGERALLAVQVFQFICIFGYLPAAMLVFGFEEMPTSHAMGWILPTWLALHVALILVRKILRGAIAERDLVQHA